MEPSFFGLSQPVATSVSDAYWLTLNHTAMAGQESHTFGKTWWIPLPAAAAVCPRPAMS
jgi:hypothetical protein